MEYTKCSQKDQIDLMYCDLYVILWHSLAVLDSQLASGCASCVTWCHLSAATKYSTQCHLAAGKAPVEALSTLSLSTVTRRKVIVAVESFVRM